MFAGLHKFNCRGYCKKGRTGTEAVRIGSFFLVTRGHFEKLKYLFDGGLQWMTLLLKPRFYPNGCSYSVSYDDDCTLDNETYAGMEGLFMTAPWKVVKTIKTTIKESESVGVVCFALVVEMSVEGVLTVVNMKIHFVLFRSMLTSGLHINYQESEELGYSK